MIEIDGAIKKASDRLEFLVTDKTFLHELHLREIALSDYNSAISYAKDEGRQEGIIATARNMLRRGTPIQHIMEDTGLSEAEIADIKV